MRTFFALVLVASAYVVIYYRLLVRHFYEKQHHLKESTFGAIFSFPPYKALPEPGRKYARRYWVAVGVMVGAVIVLTVLADFPAWQPSGQGG